MLEPLCKANNLKIYLRPRYQTIEDFTSKEAASALQSFSSAANKFTRSDLPADEARWWTFIIEAHKAQGTLNSCSLQQWLIEKHEWDAEIARELASDFEKSKELLRAYDAAV